MEDMEDEEMDAETHKENTKVRGLRERLRSIVAPTASWTTTQTKSAQLRMLTPLRTLKHARTRDAGVICYYCMEPGHINRDCPIKKRADNGRRQRENSRALLAGQGSVLPANRCLRTVRILTDWPTLPDPEGTDLAIDPMTDSTDLVQNSVLYYSVSN